MSQEKHGTWSRPEKTFSHKTKGNAGDIAKILIRDSKEGGCSDSSVYLSTRHSTWEKWITKVLHLDFADWLLHYARIQNSLPECFSFRFLEEDINSLSVIDTRIIDNYFHHTPVDWLTCAWNGTSYVITDFVVRVLRLPGEPEHVVVDQNKWEVVYWPISFVEGQTFQELSDTSWNRTFCEYYLRKVQDIITKQYGIQFLPSDMNSIWAVWINHKLEKIEWTTAYVAITDIGDSIEMIVKLNP